MDSTRQQKVARLVQKELSEIIQRLGPTPFNGKMLTVTTVRISPDLSVARVYLSVFPSADAQETLKLAQNMAREIRFELGKRVRHQLRIVPELAFFIDDNLDYLENIQRLLNK